MWCSWRSYRFLLLLLPRRFFPSGRSLFRFCLPVPLIFSDADRPSSNCFPLVFSLFAFFLCAIICSFLQAAVFVSSLSSPLYAHSPPASAGCSASHCASRRRCFCTPPEHHTARQAGADNTVNASDNLRSRTQVTRCGILTSPCQMPVDTRKSGDGPKGSRKRKREDVSNKEERGKRLVSKQPAALFDLGRKLTALLPLRCTYVHADGK